MKPGKYVKRYMGGQVATVTHAGDKGLRLGLIEMDREEGIEQRAQWDEA